MQNVAILFTSLVVYYFSTWGAKRLAKSANLSDTD